MTMASVGSAIRAACIAVPRGVARRAIADRRSRSLARHPTASSGTRAACAAAAMPRQASPIGTSWRAPASRSRPLRPPSPIPTSRAAIRCMPSVPSSSRSRSIPISARSRVRRVARCLWRRAASSIRRLAASQCTGGMVGGIGMALMEHTVVDPRNGRPVNANLAEYLVPVNVDVPEIEAHLRRGRGPARQPARREGRRRDRPRRRGAGDRQRRLPCHGQARPRTADPHRRRADRLNAEQR